MNLPEIKPLWSSLINLAKTDLILLAIHADAILYVILSNEMGRQFF